MKILIVNYEFPPIGGGGGKASKNLALSLASRGHEVDVLTSRYKDYEHGDLGGQVNIVAVSSWRKDVHDCGILGAFSFVFKAMPVYRSMIRAKSYDALHFFFSMPTGILFLLGGKKLASSPITVVSLRGSDVPGYDPFNKGLQLFHKILRPFTLKIWRGVDHVVALSDSLRKTAQKVDKTIDYKIIPNGIEDAFFVKPERETRSERLELITVSRIIERKGIQHIVRALHDLSHIDYRLSINGTGNYLNSLKELVSQLGLGDRIVFGGFLTPEKVPQALAKADLFILPSMAEAFGNVFVEAMAAGLPIISTKVGGIVDYVSEENGILVDYDDNIVLNLNNAIEKLNSDPELRHSMSKANVEKMKSEYQWSSIARSYEKLYQNK